MIDVFVFLSHIFVEIFVGAFLGNFKLKFTQFFSFVRLRTRYLSVKSPFRFDFCWAFKN